MRTKISIAITSIVIENRWEKELKIEQMFFDDVSFLCFSRIWITIVK